MAELTIDQKRALALASARQRQAASSFPNKDIPKPTGIGIGETATGIAGQINRPIAGALGFPADVANAFARDVLGAEGSPVPFGREDIMSGMESVGMPVAAEGQRPQGPGEYMARGVGEAATALLPTGGAFSTLARGTGKVADWATDYMMTLTRRPKTTLAAEAGFGASAGAGGYVGNLIDPDNPNAEVLGELAGGFTGAGVVPALKLATRLPGIRFALKSYVPFTKAAARVRAEDRVRGIAQDPDTARARIEAEGASGLTPAEKSKDPGLLALERAVLDENPRMAGENADRVRDVMRALRNELSTVGTDVPVSAPREVIEQRKEYLASLVDLRAQQAASRAEARLAQVRPQQRKSQASSIVREEVEKAFEDVRKQESQLWDLVPRETMASTSSTMDAYATMKGTMPRAQEGNIPDVARRLLDPESNAKFGGEETIHELWGLRSELLDTARKARANDDFGAARVADELADAVLVDLGAVPGNVSGEAGEALRTALDFSRESASRFKRGSIGRILGYERAGGASVDPTTTLDVAMAGGGPKAAVGARQLEETGFDKVAGEFTGQNTTIQGGVREYLLNQFEDAAVRGDAINPEAAKTFIRRNADAIDRVPGLRDELEQAAGASGAATRAGERAERVTKALDSKSATARFLNAPVEREVDRIVSSQNPAEATAEILRKVRKDSTGKAVDGLKAGFVDYMTRRAQGGGFDEAGKPFLSGRSMRASLEDKRFADAASQVFSRAEMGRLRRVADELEALEIARGSLPGVDGVMNDTPSKVIEILARVMAARKGAVLGGGTSGGSLQGAQIMSGMAKKLVGRLTNDGAHELIVRAVKDPELMSALLSPTASLKQQRVANRKMNAWLAGPGAEIVRNYGIIVPENKEERQ